MKSIKAADFVNDIRSGMSDSDIRKKYQLSDHTLRMFLEKAVRSGLLTDSEVTARNNAGLVGPQESEEAPVELIEDVVHKCPACGVPQQKKFEECPQCGVIVAKYEQKQLRMRMVQEKKQKAREDPLQKAIRKGDVNKIRKLIVKGSYADEFLEELAVASQGGGQTQIAKIIRQASFEANQRPGADEPRTDKTQNNMKIRVPLEAGHKADEIEYKIFGEEMQFVVVELDPYESVVAEAGAMMYMTGNVDLQTIFGDGSDKGSPNTGRQSLFGKVLSAGKRVVTGESLFMTLFTNTGNGKEHVAFAAPYAGKIVPLHLDEFGGEIFCQKDSFLCAARGVSLGIALQKKIGAGLFGGEGFILQRLTGDGMVFVHAGGTVVQRVLEPNEIIRLDTGCLVALEPKVSFDIQYVGSVKTAIFGGEGLFFAMLRGPGSIWLQSLPLSRLADRIYSAAPQTGGPRTGEGSVLDVLGGLGDLIDGE
jgi:uncharacterized protein (TIGR00266 family)